MLIAARVLAAAGSMLPRRLQ